MELTTPREEVPNHRAALIASVPERTFATDIMDTGPGLLPSFTWSHGPVLDGPGPGYVGAFFAPTLSSRTGLAEIDTAPR